MAVPLIYKSNASFGLDIGSRTAKFAQLTPHGKGHRVLGYGYANFAADSIVEGIITEPEMIAKAIREAISAGLHGQITAKQVVASLPVSKVFTRTLQLPPMSANDLDKAIHYEAEQYVPVPVNDLYLDYEIIGNPSEKADHTDVLMVAAPRAIVDSYIKLFGYLGVDVQAIETSLIAITRAMARDEYLNQAVLVIDFGSRSADLTVYEKVIRVTGSFAVGGDDLTDNLTKSLAITPEQANEIKYKFGIGPSDLRPKIVEALKPQLQTMVSEMRKAIKYYTDRGDTKDKINTVIITGGSASLPGLSDYLTTELTINTIVGDPWAKLEVPKGLEITPLEAPMYATALGLAMRGRDA